MPYCEWRDSICLSELHTASVFIRASRLVMRRLLPEGNATSRHVGFVFKQPAVGADSRSLAPVVLLICHGARG